ncbi:MAG: cytosine deaminase [Geminicoccaceae bacterium]
MPGLDELPKLAGGRFVLGGARVPACLLAEPPAGGPAADADGLLTVDILVADEHVAAIGATATRTAAGPHAPTPGEGAPRVELGGRMVWPCPVDLHTHLDKGHIWPRAANPDGTFMGALATVQVDRERNWSAADVAARFEFGLRCALAHGTCAIRTHLDSLPPQDAISWPVFAELRARWAGRIELQAVSLAMGEHYRGEAGLALTRRVAAHGGVLGLVPAMGPELDADLDRFLTLAAEHGLDADCHIDETLDPASETLRRLALAVLRTRFPGTVVAGHCCSLSRQDGETVRRTLDLVAEAGIGIVSLPMCNMYLQDRITGRTPRIRGVTLAHELKARGIPVAFASDNCRDPFYAYGDHDLHEVFREAVRIAHLDHPIGDWPAAVAAVPARLMGLAGQGWIAVGGPADLVLLTGRAWSEVLSRPEGARTVLRRGRPIATALPNYAELDDLLAGLDQAAGR